MQGGGFCEKIWIVIIALLSIVFLNVCEDPNLISTKWDGHTHRYATGDNLDETIPGDRLRKYKSTFALYGKWV